MTHAEIMTTDRKIAYVDNTGEARMFHKEILAAVHTDSTELPEEIADLMTLSFVQISANERRAIVNWA